MPMPQSPFGSAATDLGLGDMLGQQVKDETDEERKRRLQQIAAQKGGMGLGAASAMLGLNGPGATLGSLAGMSFGGR